MLSAQAHRIGVFVHDLHQLLIVRNNAGEPGRPLFFKEFIIFDIKK
jgi:hypothetical protein